MAKGKNVLTTGDVARICNVAPRTVSKWFDSGQLGGYRIPGSKDRRIPLNELVRFMKANNIPTEALPAGRVRVLIVDGSADSTPDLIDGLKAKGDYEVRVASSGFETGAALQKFSPHVVLINLLANGTDAHGLCKSIRSIGEFAAIKIVALSNHLSSQEATALLRNGFDAYVPYPTDTPEIIKRIEQAAAITN